MHLGVPEILVLLIIVVLIFGPSRLAGLGKGLGDGIRDFKAAVHGEPANDPNPHQHPQE